MSQAKLLKATTAISDLASEMGVPNAQKLATMKTLQRHVDGLIRKLEGDATPASAITPSQR
jgi:hypothetical protein